jgi:hypothetical protein
VVGMQEMQAESEGWNSREDMYTKSIRRPRYGVMAEDAHCHFGGVEIG